jgi:hypothetical protein
MESDYMQKFNPNEYKDLQMSTKKNGSTINNFFVPVLIVACSCLAMLGITFSTKLVGENTEVYKVRVDIINGEKEFFETKVTEGAFRHVLASNNSFGSISCTQGELKYDPITSTITSIYVNKDIYCVLVFKDDGTKYINVDDLKSVNDNHGTSYYYKADANNNYIIVNNKVFRIIRVNGDGTLRVMLNEVVLASDYGFEEYSSSTLRTTLKNWYNVNMSGLSYVVEGDFDNNNYEGYELDNLVDYDSYLYDYVGTLSVREAELMSKDVSHNFLDTVNGVWLMNPSGTEHAHYIKDGVVQLGTLNETHNVRPVINIKVDGLKGEGTLNNPYTFE